MPDTSTRRLAAIMFTGIAGYTAMMQHDEQDAPAKARSFQAVPRSENSGVQGNVAACAGGKGAASGAASEAGGGGEMVGALEPAKPLSELNTAFPTVRNAVPCHKIAQLCL